MAAALLIFVPPLQQFRRTKDRNNTGSSLNAACKLDFLSCTLEGWLFFGPKPPLSPSESNDEARTSPGVSRPAFRIESMSDGTRDDNIVYHVTVFTGPAGARVVEGFMRLGSPEDPVKQLHATMEQAVKVLQSASKDGTTAGLFRSSSTGKTVARLMWTQGNVLHEIVAASLKDALALQHPETSGPTP